MQTKHTRVSDRVIEMIKQLIQEQRLVLGDRLPSERQLAEMFNVSRSPVREAIRTLNSQGFLVTKPGGGSYVQSDIMSWPLDNISPLTTLLNEDPHYRYDVLEARHALETSTAWYAALRATPQDKKKIKACFDIMLEYQKKEDATMSAHADAQFHLAIAEASHNIVLLQVMRSLFDLVSSTVKENRHIIFENKTRVKALTEQHEAVMQAIFAGNAPEAKRLMDHHIDFVRATIRTTEENQARLQRATRLSDISPLL